jgi:gas vesicle protein
MYTVLTPLVEKRLRKQLANIITEKLVKSVEYLKDNIIKVEAQVRNQVTDVARTKVKGVTGDLKRKHQAWQSDSNPQVTQVKEE